MLAPASTNSAPGAIRRSTKRQMSGSRAPATQSAKELKLLGMVARRAPSGAANSKSRPRISARVKRAARSQARAGSRA